MLDKIRLNLSAAFMWTSVNVAPREVRPILNGIVAGFTGIAGQVEAGRTGGVILTPWSISREGKNFAAGQLISVRNAAKEYRDAYEGVFPATEPASDTHTYAPKTRLPETNWRPASTEEELYEEYRQWCIDNSLEWISAEEQLNEQGLTGQQRLYLVRFIKRWNAAVDKAVDKPTDNHV